MKRTLVVLGTLLLISSSALGQILQNARYRLQITGAADIRITNAEGDARIFAGTFAIMRAEEDPAVAHRYANIGTNHNGLEEVKYHVITWGRTELKTIDPTEHVMDGFDPQIDRELEKGRTANYFLAAEYEIVQARSAVVEDDRIVWEFPTCQDVELQAHVTLDSGATEPLLEYSFKARKPGWYSVGYVGAEGFSPAEIDELYQPMIWQEKRFPNLPYLTEGSLCPFPTTMVTRHGVTTAVLAEPGELPFMPLPKLWNSRFGVMLRTAEGMAQPMIFAPILGGAYSQMAPADEFSFKAYLVVHHGDLSTTHEHLARTIYGFRDHRENVNVSLNETFENMLEYNMGPWSRFVPELRGSNYATDVPGAVKNITGLHPLSLAVVTNDVNIYKLRTRPMLEYSLSRERYLFATNPKINRDGTSARLFGPGAPMSDFAAVLDYSQKRMNCHLALAKNIYHTPINRSLNLTAQLYGDRWQNALYLYNSTGNEEYLQAAIEGADEYLHARVHNKPTDFNDPQSRGMFFWTSYVFQWMELYLLYEATGHERYLDAARRGARAYAQLSWLCPVIPDGEVTVNIGGKVPRYRVSEKYADMFVPEETVPAWQVSEIGLTPESSPTCHGHRAIYLAQQAPWMLRIARDSGDDFLHDIARSAVIGRYESFPGYHINAGRTTAHAKKDFALRPLNELNGVTSLHYNHPWPHAAMLMDYLVSDAYYRSDGAVDFPAEYAEGYAYCRSQVYGAAPGRIYGNDGLYLYMPQGLAKSSDIQLNYIAARSEDTLYITLTNQSDREVNTMLKCDLDLTGMLAKQAYQVRLWKQNRPAGITTIVNGEVPVRVAAKGITVLAISGVKIRPAFQSMFYAKAEPWAIDRVDMDFGKGTTAVLYNMGSGLQSVYSYLKANGEFFESVTLHYSIDGAAFQDVNKAEYPFEFTIELPEGASEFNFKYSAVRTDGSRVSSDIASLRK